jgi:hypothetical protein
MANKQNLKPLSPNKARELGAKGGKASGESRRKRRTFREIFTAILASDIPDTDVGALAEMIKKNFGVASINEATAYAVVFRAMNGDTRAFEILRDTIGEKPSDKVDLKADTDFRITVEYVK